MTVDTRTIYFITSRGYTYTSDKYDLRWLFTKDNEDDDAGLSDNDSGKNLVIDYTKYNLFAGDYLGQQDISKIPYINISEITDFNTSLSTLTGYNGLYQFNKNQTVKMTLTFQSAEEEALKMGDLSANLRYLAVSTHADDLNNKGEIFFKPARLLSADYSSSEYENGIQIQVTFSVFGNWNGDVVNSANSGDIWSGTLQDSLPVDANNSDEIRALLIKPDDVNKPVTIGGLTLDVGTISGAFQSQRYLITSEGMCYMNGLEGQGPVSGTFYDDENDAHPADEHTLKPLFSKLYDFSRGVNLGFLIPSITTDTGSLFTSLLKAIQNAEKNNLPQIEGGTIQDIVLIHKTPII